PIGLCPLVIIQAQTAKTREDGGRQYVIQSHGVSVLHAQNERAAFRARQQVVVERCASTAHVQEPGRAGGEADADRHARNSLFRRTDGTAEREHYTPRTRAVKAGRSRSQAGGPAKSEPGRVSETGGPRRGARPRDRLRTVV